MKLEKYQEYKDSGEVWLGKIPKHWKVIRTKNVFKDINEKSKTGDETLLTVSHITGVTPRSEKNVNMFMAETMEGYKKCKVGDLIVNTMWAWMGALGTSKHNGICSPAYNVYRPLKSIGWNYRYYNYLFRIPNAVMEMTRFSKGIVASRLRLYPIYFYQINTIIPPIQEQIIIANYLDRATNKIDKKIDLLTKKINHYQDLKRALVNRVVTKGLDDTVEMKQCDIEWIDEIPKSWKVKRLKDVSNIGTGSRNTEDRKDKGIYPFFVRSQKIENINTYSFDGEAILTAGDGVGVGKVFHYINGKFDYHQRVYRISHFQKSDGKYLFFYIKMFLIKDAMRFNSKATVDSLRLPTFQNFKVVLPPIDEQRKIVGYLNQKTSIIDKLIETITTQVDYQKALRKSLINDVVTGKLKVSKD